MLDEAFSALNASGAHWCLLRGARDTGDDVDLLLRTADLEHATTALVRLRYLPLRSWGRGSHSFFVGYDAKQDHWVKLDIATELAFGNHFAVRTEAAPAVLGRRIRRGALWVPAPDDQFWTLLLHCLLDRRAVPPEYAEPLVAMATEASESSELATWFAANAPAGWDSARLLDSVRSRSWQELAVVGASMASRSPAALALGARWRLVSRTAQRRATKVQTLRHRRGLAIAVLGPDGAGKSTLAHGLERSFFFPVRSVYMGLYGEAGGSLHRLGLAGRLIFLWLRYLVGAYHRARGRLVVYDRYAYDALIARGSVSARSRLRRWLIAHACPTPDIVVVLDAPGDVLFARAHEHSVESLERQRRGYLNLRRQLRDVVVLDGTLSADVLRRKVTAVLWDRYVRRHGD